MDIFFKTIGGTMVVLILWLSLSGVGKDYALLLGLLSCCMIAGITMLYLDPVISFMRELVSLLPLDSRLLEILLKAVGIGLVGEIASMICADSGNSALGKTLQLLTNILILWLTLPLLESLLALIRQILEEL